MKKSFWSLSPRNLARVRVRTALASLTLLLVAGVMLLPNAYATAGLKGVGGTGSGAEAFCSSPSGSFAASITVAAHGSKLKGNWTVLSAEPTAPGVVIWTGTIGGGSFVTDETSWQLSGTVTTMSTCPGNGTSVTISGTCGVGEIFLVSIGLPRESTLAATGFGTVVCKG